MAELGALRSAQRLALITQQVSTVVPLQAAAGLWSRGLNTKACRPPIQVFSWAAVTTLLS